MFLAKRCDKKHNIKSGSLLKLGSLYEYRATEKLQIADREEGIYTFKVKLDGIVTIDRVWHNTIFPGMVIGDNDCIQFPGQNSMRMDSYTYVEREGENVTLQDSSATITREDHNSFIFCMSHVKEQRDCMELFPDYDDQWFINYKDAHKFGIAIGTTLLSTIDTESRVGNFIIPEEFCNRDLRINFRCDEVTYDLREIHINNTTHLLPDELKSRMKDIAFTKPPIPFKSEKEYRFQYTLHSNGTIVPPSLNSLLINSEPLQKFLI
ncbi:hypothetical protein EJA72_27350 [Pseudomonas sp. PB120]|uniref:hypothetical protein n=1 Tax=Pseudomonas sp. PB120 TaxID=2494700 RepID=UPI0012FDDA85|nr:hypothetical protein [Pseudomonas sp. PB120]MVV51928.1 hypothetical protein [Pseudomonas sp. PB120]